MTLTILCLFEIELYNVLKCVKEREREEKKQEVKESELDNELSLKKIKTLNH